MPLIEQIDKEMLAAMKEKDETKISTLRMLKSVIHNQEIANKKKLSDEEISQLIQSQIKSRRDSIDLYKKGDRQDLAEKEKQEINILENYLPEQLSEEKIRQEVLQIISQVNAQSRQDMGKVMGKAAAVLKGKADMSTVSKIVKENLEK